MVGEYLIYHFDEMGLYIDTIIIANGHVKDETAWKDNGRVKKLKMYIDNKPFAILLLELLKMHPFLGDAFDNLVTADLRILFSHEV